MLDLLIRGGLIIDGSAIRASTAPSPSRTSASASCAATRRHRGQRVIDATSRVVCPVHRHARALRAGDPRRAAARAEGPPGHHQRS